MAVTSTQSSSKGVINFQVGKYHDTGAAAEFDITTGFLPRYIKVVNVGTGGTMIEWYEGMTADTCIHVAANGDRALVGSAGITANSNGFTVSDVTLVNISDDQLYWLAIG